LTFQVTVSVRCSNRAATCANADRASQIGQLDSAGKCATSFFATKELREQLVGDFPQCLDGAPILLPSSGTQLRAGIDRWLEQGRIYPRMIAEFDDSALMKAFGPEGAGIVIAPAAIRTEVERQYQVKAIRRADEVTERCYAISVERRVSHPVAAKVVEAARQLLFAEK
jgi:LysR family transcriptional activator of nhaA